MVAVDADLFCAAASLCTPRGSIRTRRLILKCLRRENRYTRAKCALECVAGANSVRRGFFQPFSD
jgi:hypothetical protein